MKGDEVSVTRMHGIVNDWSAYEHKETVREDIPIPPPLTGKL